MQVSAWQTLEMQEPTGGAQAAYCRGNILPVTALPAGRLEDLGIAERTVRTGANIVCVALREGCRVGRFPWGLAEFRSFA